MPKGALARPGVIRLLFATACFSGAAPALARAQVIPIKTTRIAEADLSSYIPSANAGMGRLLTLADTVLDPFDNPASARRIRLPYVVGSLASYSVSHDLGNGSTTPIGVFVPRGPWFAGFNGARQSVSPADLGGFGGFGDVADHNKYGFALFGRSIGTAAVALSGSWSTEGALDGANLVYPGMASLDRVNRARDVRLGVSKTFKRGATLEAVALEIKSTMRGDIRYLDRLWNPNLQQTTETERIEHDHSQIQTRGVHATLSVPLKDSAWRVGAGLTANKVEYTTLPLYGPVNLRRDPGRSSAYNGIIGFSRAGERLRFGMDAIYEPIWSRIAVTGEVNNDRYRFYNTAFRGGISADYHPLGQQTSVRLLFGAQVHNIRFMRTEYDSAQVASDSWHAWDEWTHNWGVSFLDKAMSLHLQWRVQSGAQRPGTLSPQNNGGILVGSPVFGFFTPPQLGLLSTRVSTLQILATVPIR
jgi:hypothetical protein